MLSVVIIVVRGGALLRAPLIVVTRVDIGVRNDGKIQYVRFFSFVLCHVLTAPNAVHA